MKDSGGLDQSKYITEKDKKKCIYEQTGIQNVREKRAVKGDSKVFG